MEIRKLPVGMLQTNCYLLLVGDNVCAAIDPGGQPEKILHLVEENGWELKWILLTHGHYDHMGAVNALREKTAAQVVAHRDDVEMLREPTQNVSIDLIGEPYSVTCDRIVEDGEQMKLGNATIKVLHTPGHTKGSCCYQVENVLFAGDTLFAGGIGRTDLYGGSYAEITASLKKLAALEDNFSVYTGHGEDTTLDHERRTNPYLGVSYDDLF